jgi:FkbM family methyltransferase
MGLLIEKIKAKVFKHTLKTINSQKGQDHWVIKEVFFGKKSGFFLEMGATNGLYVSNTLVLERDYGWNGICVEPSPLDFSDLQKNRSCLCINKCVDEIEGNVEFILAGEVGGIIDTETDNSYEKRKSKIERLKKEGKVMNIETVTLEDLLDKNNAPAVIDYFSLDVEGAETRVLRQFDFNKYIFSALTIERPTPELNSILFNNGYVFVKNAFYDTYYVHESLETIDSVKKGKFKQVPAKRD